MREARTDLSTDALEDIAYLSRSANRVRILDVLIDGSYTRGELAELTEASRTTVDRIINELEDRGWVERRNDGTYVATARGDHLMVRFRPFIDAVEALNGLDEAITWLPDDLSIGLEHFKDAIVRQPEGDDPVEAVEYMTDLVDRTTEFRFLAHLVPPEPFEVTMAERVASGEMRLEGVATTAVIQYIGGRPDRLERWGELLETGARVHRTDDSIPCNLWIFDDHVFIKKSGPGAIDDAYSVPIISQNPTVRAWADDLIDEWLETSTPVGMGTFPERR